MIGPNSIHLTLGDNPDVAKLFAGKSAGDELCVGEIHGVISEITGDRVLLAVTKIDADTPDEPDEDKEKDYEEGDGPKEQPPVLVMGGGEEENPLLLAASE